MESNGLQRRGREREGTKFPSLGMGEWSYAGQASRNFRGEMGLLRCEADNAFPQTCRSFLVMPSGDVLLL